MVLIRALRRLAEYGERLPVRWPLAAVFAAAITYADGFWLTATQGAVGAVERIEPPFFRWARDATLLLPVVFLAVLAALLVTRRLFTHTPRARARLLGAALLVALLSGAVGVAAAASSALEDYRLQVHHMGFIHLAPGGVSAASADPVGFGEAPYALYCDLRDALVGAPAGGAVEDAITRLEYATFSVHVRALVVVAALMLTTNLLIAGVAIGALRDRVWAARLGAAMP
jgi:hypothetical protein